jgi:predicted Zn-dependent protease
MFTTIALTLLAAPTLQSPLAEATRAFQTGDYAAVLEHVGAVSADAEDWPRMQYLAGETHLVLGRVADAETAFRNVLGARPKAVPAHVGLGRALTLLGKLDDAGASLEAALRAEPGDVGARTALGELLGRKGEFEKARETLEAVLESDPKNPFATRALVEVLLRAEKHPDAAVVAEAFATARPKHPMGPFLLAVVMERDGEDAMAIQQYQRALQLDDAFLDAHKNLAILCHTLSNTYQDKERTELAFAHYERYFELGGADPSLKQMHDTLLQFKDQILGS